MDYGSKSDSNLVMCKIIILNLEEAPDVQNCNGFSLHASFVATTTTSLSDFLYKCNGSAACTTATILV